MAIQIRKAAHVIKPKPAINATLIKTPRIGTTGTQGVLKGRGRLGCFLRMITTAMHTTTNAKSVPMLVRFHRRAMGVNAAPSETNTISSRFDFQGVRKRGWTSEKSFGSSRSFDIE